MTQEEHKEAPKVGSSIDDVSKAASAQAEELDKGADIQGDLSNDQASQELPVQSVGDADPVVEGGPAPKEVEVDSEEQLPQDDLDDQLRPPMPPSIIPKGRPLGPIAGGGGSKPHPRPGPR